MSNRLANETSPYLLQHADNPVDWYPWGSEALEHARRENKPIFLSIGYAACHWCHVMAHESFEDPETAALMNDHFVNIKVDREERPDLDSVYMEAVVAMTGQGGWPMSVFLTPEGEPFFGGTYFPPARRFNIPSFGEILSSIARIWREDRDRLLAGGKQLTGRLSASGLTLAGEKAGDAGSFDQAAERLFQAYDWRRGGWGTAPKFPQPMAVEFLLRRHARTADKLALDMAVHALRAMAAGGIFDQLGGGFARYSVDEGWLVPHFEKMLYDNAQLALVYLHAWQVTGEQDLLAVADATLDFLIHEMRDKHGGFYSSLDADSEGEEGKFYVWTIDEITDGIGDPRAAELFINAYGATQAGNFEGANILRQAQSVEEAAAQFDLTVEEVENLLDEARSKLLQLRSERVRPGLDDKVLAAWNGLTLVSFAEAARATGRADRLQTARQLAAFCLEHLMLEGALQRSWRCGRARFRAYLEDHASIGLGLLSLYQADFDPRWYRAAIAQAEEILTAFDDAEGGFFDTRHDHEQLIVRPKSIQDSPTPSGNSMACMLLLRLAALTGDRRYAEPAEAALYAMQLHAARHPAAFSGWLCALDFAWGPQLQLALCGSPDEPGFQALAAVANAEYAPNLVLAGGQSGMEHSPPLMVNRSTQDGKPTAYLCQSFTCKLPTTSSKQLELQLQEALR